MQILKLSNSFSESGTDVTRLWLAPGLVRLGAVFGDGIQCNTFGVCWDTTAQRAIWEAVLYDENEPYPDPDFNHELTRVIYIVAPKWEEGQPGYLCVRELASGAEVRLGGSHLFFCAMTPDGRDVFARELSVGNRACQLRRWRIPTESAGMDKVPPHRKWSIRLSHGRSVIQQLDNLLTGLAVSPDGKRIAAGYRNGAITAWNVAGPREVAKIPEVKSTKYRRYSTLRLAFSPDGTRLAAIRRKPRDRKCNHSVSVWSVPDGKQEKGPREKVSVNGAAFSPDGQTLLTAREDGSIGVWDTATWKLRREYAWKIGKLFSVAFSPDGLTCAAGGEKGQVVIWDVDA